jgi:alkaline phosphatase D
LFIRHRFVIAGRYVRSLRPTAEDTQVNPRRLFLRQALATSLAPAAGSLAAGLSSPAVIAAESERPKITSGIQFGDVTGDRAIVWSRADRPSRLMLEVDSNERFANPRRIAGPYAMAETDYTARVDLTRLAPGERVFVRASFEDLHSARTRSEPVSGSFWMPPATAARPIRFTWSGDAAGQGFGINPEWGGMRIFEAMRKRQPQFFIHSGDTIYADGPIKAEQPAENGRIWKNIVTEQVSKVAETLDEYRGRHRYNLMDDNLRRFAAEVPQVWQWDDHEVTNNWSDSKDLSADARYTEKNVPLLVARGARAFLEYAPMRWYSQEESQRVYRKIGYGPLLDVFVLDMRAYRGPNSYNRQTVLDADSAFMGATQIAWLKRELGVSTATWKVVAADMPIGLLVNDGKDAQNRDQFEALANGNGPPLGRELELADLLRTLKRGRIRNVVWLTADVHYTAAHFYDPNKAQFQDFDPFWEFVSGPLNAGSFGPNVLDDTFGPQLMFAKAPKDQNTSPFAELQFFGEVNIDPSTRQFAVDLCDLDGKSLYKKVLDPV